MQEWWLWHSAKHFSFYDSTPMRYSDPLGTRTTSNRSPFRKIWRTAAKFVSILPCSRTACPLRNALKGVDPRRFSRCCGDLEYL
jgi:hypothetical protein